MRTKTMELSGWGRYPRRNGRVARPENVSSMELVESPVIARGQGKSYGDAAIPTENGCALLTERLNRFLAFDENTGILKAEAGTTLAEVLETFVPRGWFPAVTPGTKFVSIGGCVAADVHGKNHHHAGSFGAQTTELGIKLADGTNLACSVEREADLFRATVGGMGLTGVITEVSFRLIPIETARMMVRHQPARDLEECLRLLEDPSEDEHVACWIDGTAKGARLGAGIMMSGRHAGREELQETASNPLRFQLRRSPRLPFSPPAWALNSLAAILFNRLYSSRQTRQTAPVLAGFDSFFYPLDALGNWNAFYGDAGFVQHQCVLPSSEAAAGFRFMLEALAASGLPSFLTVLKRFGAEGKGLLSFPLAGYTLSLDFAMRGPPLFDLLKKLDEIVLRHGGRVYLAKDACLDAGTFRAMYPRYRNWQQIKARVDPGNRFRSALSERLGLTLPT
jgi:decaprenylphospho-beta-D-ribofuranose 2-oxidase